MAIHEPARRRKKKKQGGNGPLIVLLSAGGLLVVGGIIVAIILLTRPTRENPDPNKQLGQGPPAGDKKAKDADKKEPERKEPPKDIGTKRRPDNYRLRINRVERLNELRSIGQLYLAYQTELGKPPAKVEDFLNYIQRDAQALHKAIASKYYFVLANVRSGIVAYEYDPDSSGRHGTTDINATVQEISSEELLKKLKAQGK